MKKNRAILILKNALSNYLRQIVQIGTFVLLTPFIAHRLGTDGYGLWSLVQATIGIFGLADLGFAQSVVRFIADARGRQDMDRHRVLTATFFWVYAGLGALVFLVALGLTPFLQRLLSLPADRTHDAVVVFVLVASRSALSMPLGMFTGVLTGHQRQAWANFIRSLGTLCYAGVTAWALSVRPSIQVLALVSLCAQGGANVAAMAVSLAKIEGISLSLRRFRWSMVREIHSFSWYFFLIQVSGLIYTRVDALIIQTFMSLHAVALYAVASRLAETASAFCRQLTNALSPMIAELKGAGEEANIRAVFQKGAKLSLALAAPLLVGLFWFAEPLLVAWMGGEFGEAAAACRVLLVAMVVSVAYAAPSSALSMTGHPRFVAIAFAVGQFLNLVLTVAFIRVFGMGITGVALATFISTVVSCVIISHRVAKLFHVGQAAFLRLAVWPSVPASLVMVGGLWLAQQWLRPTALWRIAALEALACGLFGAGFLLTGLDGRERAYYRDRLMRFVRRGKDKA